MTRRLVSVDDDFNVPDNLNVRDVNLPDRLQDTALNATYATPATVTTAVAPKIDKLEVTKHASVRRSAATIFLGDSLTQIGSTAANRQYGNSMPSLVSALSDGRILFAENAAWLPIPCQ